MTVHIEPFWRAGVSECVWVSIIRWNTRRDPRGGTRFTMTAYEEILKAKRDYTQQHGRRPSLLVLSRRKAIDVCKLGREVLDELSEKCVREGEDALAREGLLGMRVQIHDDADAPDISLS